MATSDHHLNDYTISQLARDAGVSTDVIRNYELQGIISPMFGSMTIRRWSGFALSRQAKRPAFRYPIWRNSCARSTRHVKPYAWMK